LHLAGLLSGCRYAAKQQTYNQVVVQFEKYAAGVPDNSGGKPPFLTCSNFLWFTTLSQWMNRTMDE
jgi:hypothetical protein